ncbi:Gem-associated protein 5 [Portunus trituberculatus]|uniref:Gem-associated protein 5 n=1 Tax=Portunus trituberculatus TaxID=210409 RepID=A0A5B7GZD2_PORTR|nr:Gem-associated protein 5 [Portunus trituberculatus]
MAAEIETHESKGNTSHASLMHCWRGSLGTHIHLAAKQKRLTPFLVASAPQVSMKLWEAACEAYAQQLLSEGDAVTAASYLLNIHKVEEAIDVLLQHRHFREALAIVKTRLGFSQDQLGKVVGRWVNSATYDGNMDLAALLLLSTSQLEAAARTLSRRTDAGSLFVSAQVYAAARNTELAVSTGLMALQEASVRQEMDKVEAFLCHMPGMEWFRVVSSMHRLLLRVIQQEHTDYFTYLLQPSDSGGKAAEAAAVVPGVSTCLVEEVKRQWEAEGFSQSQYQSLYQHLETHFSTQRSPSSVKHLWFLVSLSLCECLLAPSYQLWDHHLTAALRHAVTWGKANQLLHLTHALLPRGRNDMALLRGTAPDPQEGEAVPPPSLHILWQCYQQAEVALLHTYIMGNTCWADLLKDERVTDRDIEAASQETQATILPSDANSASVAGEAVVPQPDSECRLPEGSVPVVCEEKGVVTSGRDEEPSFRFPRSVDSLKTSLHSYLENIDRDPKLFTEIIGVTSSALSSPIVLLQEIVTLLHGKDILDSADKESFLCGLGAQ